MSKLSELVSTIETLSIEEMEDVKKVVEKKWLGLREQKIMKDVEDARKESKEGNTLILSSPEEIKTYLNKMILNED